VFGGLFFFGGGGGGIRRLAETAQRTGDDALSIKIHAEELTGRLKRRIVETEMR